MAKKLRRRYENSRSTSTWEEYQNMQVKKAKVIQKAKTLYFRESVHDAGELSKRIWALAKWAKDRSYIPKALPVFPAMKSNSTRTIKATSFEDKVQILKERFFPPPQEASLEDIDAAHYLDPWQSNTQITPDEVKAAIQRPKPDKAPRVNGIPSRFLKQVLEVFLPHFVYLFQACIDLGYHPKEFWTANTIVLKKPRKEDYSLAESYRPIALLDTLGKALETIFTQRLSDLAETHDLLPAQQMGARRGRSTETALELLVESVHTVWHCSKKNAASLLSLDVAGAFDYVSHPRLLHNLRSKRIPEYIVQWTESFLTGRSTSITLGRRTSNIFPVQAGIPQGSPISPILFLFFNAPLIENCATSGLKVQVGGFVDDIHLIAYGNSTESNCKTLEKAHQICLKWAQRHGASFAPKKYELIHLTCCPQKFNMEAKVDLGVNQILPKATLKVLSLWIDGKLRWGPHIKETQAKMTAQTMALTKVATSTWGATLNKARQVYTAVVRPAMTYGATIWHTPKDTKTKGLGPVAKLLPLQNKCLRSITGAYKATNTKVLEAESGVIPLDIYLDQIILRSRDKPRCSEVIMLEKTKIRRKLSNRRGKKLRPKATPMAIKDTWTRDTMDKAVGALQMPHEKGQVQLSRSLIIKKWAKER